MATKKNENMDFETAMARIGEIASRLEDTTLKLDESLKLYEEGVALVALCRKKLDEAGRRISVLMPDENGEMVERDFSAPEAE